MKTPLLIESQRVESYFYEQVRSALANQHFKTGAHTEFYLVRLLSDFCHRQALEQSTQANKPLAILYLESIQASREEGFRLLKHLGDFSLFISGFFQDSLQRRSVDLNYYMSLGGSAYQRLHAMMEQSVFGETFQEIFFELACNFTRFVDIISEISENSRLDNDSDLLKLYEKWQRNHSKRLLHQLQARGIFPIRSEPFRRSQ